jgi:hypothetical protein
VDEDAGAINQVQKTKIKEFRDLNLEPRTSALFMK